MAKQSFDLDQHQAMVAEPEVEEHASEAPAVAEAMLDHGVDRTMEAEPVVEEPASEAPAVAEAILDHGVDRTMEAESAVEEHASEAAEVAEAEPDQGEDRTMETQAAVEAHVSEVDDHDAVQEPALDGEVHAAGHAQEAKAPVEAAPGTAPADVAATTPAWGTETREDHREPRDEEQYGDRETGGALSEPVPAPDFDEPVAYELPSPAETLRLESEWEREQAPASAQTPTQVEVPAVPAPGVPSNPVPDYVARLNDPALLSAPDEPAVPAPGAPSNPVPDYVARLNNPALLSAPDEPVVPAPGLPSNPVPDYVARLNNPALLSAPDEPAADAVLPSIPEEDLPALDEPVSARKSRVHVDHLPGMRMIAGCLPRPGLLVGIEDQHGRKRILFSGECAPLWPRRF